MRSSSRRTGKQPVCHAFPHQELRAKWCHHLDVTIVVRVAAAHLTMVVTCPILAVQVVTRTRRVAELPSSRERPLQELTEARRKRLRPVEHDVVMRAGDLRGFSVRTLRRHVLHGRGRDERALAAAHEERRA
jgi:hypothetical protein